MLFGIGSRAALLGIAALGMSAMSTSAQAAECGTDRTIDIAEMTWESATVLANIHDIILSEGFGCSTELVPGDTVTTSASMMGRGQPALAPELWMSSIEDKWDQAEADGEVVELGAAITDGTLEGLFIPRWVSEKYNLKSMEDVMARSDLFSDPEDPSKGRVYSGPPGWAAEQAVAGVYEAYEMEGNWNLFSVADAALQASIKRAFTREEPILFYYWSPASIMGQVDAVKVGLPAHVPEIYTCNTNADCEGAGKTDWPSSRVVLGAAAWLPEEAPAVADYLGKAGLTGAKISELAAYGEINGVDSRGTAEAFLRDQADIWSAWVPEDVATKVMASVK